MLFFCRLWPANPPLPRLVTWQQQSCCCTWAFENTNKCRAGLWPSLTPLCRANLLSSFWMTRVWIRAICLNLRNIFSHNRTQLALTTAHNTEKSNCWADSYSKANQLVSVSCLTISMGLAKHLPEPLGICLITINIKEGVYQEILKKLLSRLN